MMLSQPFWQQCNISEWHCNRLKCRWHGLWHTKLKTIVYCCACMCVCVCECVSFDNVPHCRMCVICFRHSLVTYLERSFNVTSYTFIRVIRKHRVIFRLNVNDGIAIHTVKSHRAAYSACTLLGEYFPQKVHQIIELHFLILIRNGRVIVNLKRTMMMREVEFKIHRFPFHATPFTSHAECVLQCNCTDREVWTANGERWTKTLAANDPWMKQIQE